MIDYKIEEQNAELVRDQIGLILVNEFNNQVIDRYNTDCEGVKFFIERMTPIHETETAVVNISKDSSDTNQKVAGSTNSTVTYNIDVYTNSKNLGQSRADTLAAFRKQRIVGIIRHILDNSIYDILGFEPGFIQGTMVTGDFNLVMKNENDSMNTTGARITFDVRLNDKTNFPVGNPLLESFTQVKLSETDFGFQYEFI